MPGEGDCWQQEPWSLSGVRSGRTSKVQSWWSFCTSSLPRPRTVNSIWFKAGKVNKKQKGLLIKTWGIQYGLSATQCQPEFPSIQAGFPTICFISPKYCITNHLLRQHGEKSCNSTTQHWQTKCYRGLLGQRATQVVRRWLLVLFFMSRAIHFFH